MATHTSVISAEEYLRTTYKPACDYIDGVLRPKSMPPWKHGLLQGQLLMLINHGFRHLVAGSEVTVRIRTDKYLVPDLIVQRRDHIQDPYPSDPVHLCVEILSPDDRISEVFAKCEDYLEWGVETTWVIDPEAQRAWIYRTGERPAEVPPSGTLIAGELSISLPALFSAL